MTNEQRAKLNKWQDRLAAQETAYGDRIDEMQGREELYAGSDELTVLISTDTKTTAVHVRNIVAECIEAQVDANIPQPKVTAVRAEDEKLADVIECMLRNELDRMPFEVMNDMMARTVPIQGGGYWLLEWDNTKRTHSTAGEICASTIHPKQLIPQDGVTDRLEDMDYFFLKVPQTKEFINKKYGVKVDAETESEPEIRNSEDDTAVSDDMVTQYIAYYRNDRGGVGLYSWVNDTPLEDLEDYQARRLRKCTKCGAVEPVGIEPMEKQTTDGTYPEGGLSAELPDDIGIPEEEPKVSPKKSPSCVYCGNTKFEESEEDYETIYTPRMRTNGPPILPSDPMTGEPTRIPYYKPDMYPVVLQRNVSIYGKLLGESDVDKIEDQQNTTNIIHGNIIDKLLMGGSILALPNQAHIRTDPERKKIYYVENNGDMERFKAIDLDENIQQDMQYLQQVYEEARQAIGITDSFQGRRDATATSGKAKEFAAAQSAGRLESKRVMKDAAFAEMFEAMFKFKLAYADEPRPVVSQDEMGKPVYMEFNRYDFLAQDEAGEWYWNDRFLFSCDTSAPLASNREALWQETRLNLQTGAFDPTPSNMIFWTLMERHHYPNSATVKALIEQQLAEQQAQQQAMQAQQMQMQQAQLGQENEKMRMQQQQNRQGQEKQRMDDDMARQRAVVDIKRQAQEDAARAAQMGRI